MKKLLLLLYFAAFSLVVCSQDIVLSFQSADGVSVIDSVKTTDPATSEISVTEGTVIAIPDATTSVRILQDELPDGSIFPNPFEGRVHIQFATSTEEEVVVSVANAAGQVILRQHKHLQPGMHRVQLSVQSQGMYFITIAGKKNTTSFKAVSLQGGGNEDRLKWLGSSPIKLTEKSTKVEEGKLYHFEIYSGENVTVIADRPTESKTYEVEFHECRDADGKNYKIVQIGEQWWMAENLTFDADSGCWAYDNDENNVVTYGRLYTWESALEACPSGWHLPSDDEWEKLNEFIGNDKGSYVKGSYYWEGVGFHLKSQSGWNASGNGTDDYGFFALPGGVLSSSYNGTGTFENISEAGGWWSATIYSNIGGGSAYYRYLHSSLDYFFFGKSNSLVDGFSVRCVKDPAPVETFKMEVDVIDLDTWSLDNPFPDVAANAKVKLLSKQNPDKSKPVYEGTSDSNGNVIFPEIMAGDYYVYVEKEAQTNLIEKENVDGQEVGYVVNGIFGTEYDIAKSISLPGTMVGDPIIVDVNEDGILNKTDKAVGYEINVTGFTRPRVYIITEK